MPDWSTEAGDTSQKGEDSGKKGLTTLLELQANIFFSKNEFS